MCGPAAPITCDNASRAKYVLSLTKNVDCVWGCFCAQGYLRNNYNGKCVLEDECRDNRAVDFAPQIPGLFKHLGLDGHATPQPKPQVEIEIDIETGHYSLNIFSTFLKNYSIFSEI